MLLVVLLIFWPIAEVLVAIKVADLVGVVPMLALLIAGWPIGSWAMRSRGGAAWRRFADALSSSRPPGREALDGALVVAGGLLILIPGFITDFLGAALLLPPTRALTRGALVRNLRSRFVVRAAGFARGARPYDVESTAVDLDQPRLHR